MVIVIAVLPYSGPTILCPVHILLKYSDKAVGVIPKQAFFTIEKEQNDITASNPSLRGLTLLSCWIHIRWNCITKI